jgi:hypothetical protein
MAPVTRILTAAEKAEVETLAAVLSAEQIADYLGMGRRTFYSVMERDEDVAARYKRGRARAVGAVAQSLITKARGGNVTAMIFYLKTQGGWRETDRLELSGRAGGPIRVAVRHDPEPDDGAFFQHMTALLDAVEPQSDAAKKLDAMLNYLIEADAPREVAG